jgi:hypothetical protein
MEELRERYEKAQQWLDQEYSKEERENIKELYINEEDLTGELNLSDFTKLEKIFISHFVDENRLEINDKEKYKDKIIKLVNAQEYLEKNYPAEQRSKITKMNIDGKNLEGDLNLEGFTNLEKLECYDNKLTSLDLSDCQQLTEI